MEKIIQTINERSKEIRVIQFEKSQNAGGKCPKAAYMVSSKNKDKQTDLGSSKGVARFMTLVLKD